MIGLIDETGEIVAYDVASELEELYPDELGLQRTDNADYTYLILGVYGDTIEAYDDFDEALREFRKDENAVKIVAR